MLVAREEEDFGEVEVEAGAADDVGGSYPSVTQMVVVTPTVSVT